MAPQELIISACAAETTSTAAGKTISTPSIHLHDLLSASSVCSFKNSTSSKQTVSFVPTQNGTGGGVFAIQEGKAIVNVWAWQKDQLHLKLHLPERLSALKVSPNGLWAAGGSPSGHIYLWELSSGLLHSSFTAHYRSISTLTFTSDSRMLLTSSLDSSVHVYLLSSILDPAGDTPKPYGTLADHTLAITDVVVGRTASVNGGRCWTASEDGTVKLWSLSAPFDLLATFSFPPSVTPTTIAVEPVERFFYVGSAQGSIYHIPLYKRRGEIGDMDASIQAIGGGIGAPIKTDGSVLSYPSAITALTLSISSTHLLIGTHSSEIHIHALPSHQHLRTISSHSGPITHLETLLRPPDLHTAGGTGTSSKSEHRPIMDVKPLERMRVGKTAKDVQEVSLVIKPHSSASKLAALRPPRLAEALQSGQTQNATKDDEQLATVLAENKKLRAQLERATKINEKMWSNIVDQHLPSAPAPTQS